MSDVKLYWSRVPGKFVNKTTGESMSELGFTVGPQFTGSTQEWYETLVETIIDASNQMHRIHLAPTPIVVASPDVHIMLMATCLYRDNLDITSHKGSLGIFRIYEDANMPRNEVQLRYSFDDERIAIVNVVDMPTL